tara:strand:- start:385 stop:642 length:258 start_codon:yes stop_codon:yes gene_type:complete
MSFQQENLNTIGGSSDGKITWEYTTTGIPNEVANTANYFGGASAMFTVDDTLFIKSEQMTKGVSAFIVNSGNSEVELGSVLEITI